MAIYKSEEVAIQAPAEAVYAKLSNFEGLADILRNAPADKIPADKKELFDQISVTSDSISFPAGPAGNLTMKLAEKREPSLVRMEGVNSPVPLSMTLYITPTGTETSEAMVEIDIKIPAMLKPMIGGTMQKMVGEFARMLRSLPFN